MQYSNNKIYALIKETSDWDDVDYVNIMSYDVVAISKDIAKLQILRDKIVENQYKDWTICTNTKDKSIKLHDSKVVFIIKNVLFIS